MQDLFAGTPMDCVIIERFLDTFRVFGWGNMFNAAIDIRAVVREQRGWTVRVTNRKGSPVYTFSTRDDLSRMTWELVKQEDAPGK